MTKCKICGKEENGYGSLLNENGCCLSCYLRQKWADDKTDELSSKVLMLEKKLKIAIGALKRLSKGETSIIIDGVAHYPNYYAEYMIEKIEEVK